ncbi:hypothetical protein Back11_11530 [Paenibacillus baekrokdamisoli]|uniref:Uncharacterized protein n=1 Tax=Paenibacillus baekrokdamisoli TaxID=1712516 RepID=A0A3G9J7L9_9BACL|nr:nucleotide-binding protein [Paenibacillus baekrokdamisoli]MBB3070454.1 putative nucleotide-binding protein [Paenibacillus baekrokdamisoli]BBH19808.1 hypothetical protein Back11_11530 [Paenibacillus baekrokdamisoli]
MASKPARNNNSDENILELKAPMEEVASKIKPRINEGYILIRFEVLSENELKHAEASFKKWNDYNTLLLKSLFTTNEISDEYDASSSISFISQSWHDEYRIFLDYLHSKISTLESILGRLELFPIASTPTPPHQVSISTIPKPQSVFIGHGRSKLWARVKTFLHDDYGINSFSFESETHVGESIIPVLQNFLERATFAILILTAEDETAEGKIRARQNVVHEAGLFQGKLGFNKVVILRQDGLDDFSNVDGLQYIGFSGENIEQAFYEIQRVLKREGIIK